jgi:mannose-6-phosphate isomerase-like protein (cupin superfamily)
VRSAQSLAELERRLRPVENGGEDLFGGPGTQLRVTVKHEKNQPMSEAEVHDDSDDVYYVLEGSATLVLGGWLEEPRETSPCEWRGARIAGGNSFEMKKGDLVVVPRGTPHQRATVGRDLSMLLIKIFARPIPEQTKDVRAAALAANTPQRPCWEN